MNAIQINTTYEELHNAIKEAISHLEKDDGSFFENKYASERVYESLTAEDYNEITDEVLEAIQKKN